MLQKSIPACTTPSSFLFKKPIQLATLFAALGFALSTSACTSTPAPVPEQESSEEAPESAEDSASQPLLSPSQEEYIQGLITHDGYPAIVLGIIDGDSVETFSFGTLDSGEEPDENTLFEIGSLTKSFTALLLADAVLKGEVELDAPVQALLPDFDIPQGESNEITLKMLATHHSGLPSMPDNYVLDDLSNPYADYSVEDMKELFADYDLMHEPGTHFEYSNLGYGLLGHALSQVANSTYDELLNTIIYEPLEMTSTWTHAADAPADRLATGHLATGESTNNWDFDAVAPAGSIVSNTEDMLRYLAAQMGQTQTPLHQAMALTQQTHASDVPQIGDLGMGWITFGDTEPFTIWHNGMTGGFSSFMGFLSDGSRGVVLLTNIARPLVSVGMDLLANQAPQPESPETMDLSPEELDEYVGTFALTDNFRITIDRRGDRLFAQATGQAAFPIFPSEEDKFFTTTAPIEISFERDESQEITALILHQNGDHRARKLSQEELDALEASRTEIELPVEVLEEYIGQYQLTPHHIFTITLQDDQLFAGLTGQPAFPIFASAKDHFFYKVVDAQIVFERDDLDQVTALILHQNGVQRAERIEDNE